MNKNFKQNEGMAVAAAILLLFSPLLDAKIIFFISFSIIIVLFAVHFIKRTGKFIFTSHNSGSK